jgi:hypothetical protein
MTWTPRRKSNRLRNSKLNPIDLDANPEAAEPLDDLEIVNFDTPVKVTESHSQHHTSPSVSSHSVRRQLITESTTPIKRARLDKNCETPETPPRKCTSPIEKDYEFDEAVDGAASFINSTEKALLHDRDYFSPNRNSCIDDINRLTEENNRIRQEYKEHIDSLKREIRELDAKHNCEIDYLKQVNVGKKRKLAAMASRERKSHIELNVKEGKIKILKQQLKKSKMQCEDLKKANKNTIKKTDLSETAYQLYVNEKLNSGKKKEKRRYTRSSSVTWQ